MYRYYNLDVLADVLAKASCMSGIKPVIGRNQCQLGMNGIKKVVSAWAIPDQTRHLKSSSCRGVCMCEGEEMYVRTIYTKGKLVMLLDQSVVQVKVCRASQRKALRHV